MKEKKELGNYIINENIDLDRIVDDYTPYLRTIIQNMVGDNLTEEDMMEIYDYLVKGHKIKVSIRFKGRQIDRPELGKEVMMRFAEELSEVSIIESQPKLEGRTMIMLLAPKK